MIYPCRGDFLNAIGIEWPYLNEDSLHQFATLTREFGQAVAQTHEDATQAVTNIAQAYRRGHRPGRCRQAGPTFRQLTYMR